LGGLRWKATEGSFDERDYLKDSPLSFSRVAAAWLSEKNGLTDYKAMCRRIGYAMVYFGDKNIKNIDYIVLQEYLQQLKLKDYSTKYQCDLIDVIKSVYLWARKVRHITEDQIPEFPKVDVQMAYRRTVTKDVQSAILDEVKKIAPFKVWLFIKWLSTYISVRPKALRYVKEGDFDFGIGVLNLHVSKEKKLRVVPMLKGDLEIAWGMRPNPMPKEWRQKWDDQRFFRHEDGQHFGKNIIYRYWKKAAANLGIYNVDLYGGTRHSSTRALRKFNTVEEIKRATMHKTSESFDRYFDMELDDVRNIYRNTQAAVTSLTGGNEVGMDFEPFLETAKSVTS
jgi:hypothetical protein